MTDLLRLLAGTMILRPYVFAFLLLFWLAAGRRIGWRRTLLFTAITWATAFAAEFSSIRTGIPFGPYYYLEATRDRELWIGGVPFMDSLSFTFLAYASRALGGYLVEGGDGRARVVRVALGTLLFVLLDVVIDPLALRGDRWFLGQIFGYPNGGVYFGVPLSNFAGWGVVGVVALGLFEALPGRAPAPEDLRLSDVALYYLVLLFNLAMTFYIGETLLGVAGALLHAPAALGVLGKAFAGRPVLCPARREVMGS